METILIKTQVAGKEKFDEGDGSSSSTNNDETETSASNLLEELNAINAREKLYLKGNKMGLNGEQKLF